MKIDYPLKRARPMTARARMEFHDAVVAILEAQPRNTRYLADAFKITVQAMNKRLRDMQLSGLVYSSHVKGVGRKEPYMWYAGEGESLLLEPTVEQQCNGGAPKQLRVTKWPAVTIPKQGIFAALGL